MSYTNSHQAVTSDSTVPSYHMTQIPRDLTQIPRRPPPLYPSDQHTTSSAAVRQHLADFVSVYCQLNYFI